MYVCEEALVLGETLLVALGASAGEPISTKIMLRGDKLVGR